MSRVSWTKMGWLTLGVGLFGLGLFFGLSGGRGLARVVWHDFLREIPDRKYSWQDFRERGANEGISGFYAFGNSRTFSMWTLSGLKTFAHTPGISVYQHEDVCAALKQFEANPEAGAVRAPQEITGDISAWQSMVERENLVTVVRYRESESDNAIDKVWSYSGKYKILNRLDEGVCE